MKFERLTIPNWKLPALPELPDLVAFNQRVHERIDPWWERLWVRRLTWAALAAFIRAQLVACVIVGIAAWILKPTPAKPIMRFTISLPPGQVLQTARPAIALSPDGTRLVYAAGSSSITSQLYVRAMDGLEARPIPGTEGAIYPFFSPDGQWIGFSAGGTLKKIALNGGVPVTLAGDVNPVGLVFWCALTRERSRRYHE